MLTKTKEGKQKCDVPTVEARYAGDPGARCRGQRDMVAVASISHNRVAGVVRVSRLDVVKACCGAWVLRQVDVTTRATGRRRLGPLAIG